MHQLEPCGKFSCVFSYVVLHLAHVFVVALVAVAAWVRLRRFARWTHARCPCCVPSCCHPLLGVKNEDRPRSRFGRKTDRGRDLDV